MAKSHASHLKPKEKNLFGRIKGFMRNLLKSLFPTRKDNINQITVKLLFLLSFVALVAASIYLIVFFGNTVSQQRIEEESRAVWYNDRYDTAERFEKLSRENPDFKGWLTIDGTNIDNGVYQHTDNEFYLEHNQNKKKNDHGALHLMAEDKLDGEHEDKNLVIYGNNMTDGTMFGTLNSYRSLRFFKKNPTFIFSTAQGKYIYKVFAVYLVDASENNPTDYDIYRSKFSGIAFEEWLAGARERSIIDTYVEVEYGEPMLTLVTPADDFENAQLVVAARLLRDKEREWDYTIKSIANTSPLYPRAWYKKYNLPYPN